MMQTFTAEKLKEAECNNDKLTKPAEDMSDICEPSNGQLLGPWLEAMMQTFTSKYKEWEEQDQKCLGALWKLGNSTERCTDVQANLTGATQECDDILSNMESFTCAWATDAVSKCSSYESCYTSVMQKYETKKQSLPAQIEQWKKTWMTAERVKCMADAVDSQGAVDTDKMDACNNESAYNTDHIKITMSALPQQETCTTPEIYPGSAQYRSEVYDPLAQIGVQVREPTLCLQWKGGCAAHSSFENAKVYLKAKSKYCGLKNKIFNCDDSEKGQFVFEHESTDNCVGTVTLTSLAGPCHYNIKSGIVCEHGYKGGFAETATLLSNPPTSGRSGQVTLQFGGFIKPLFYTHDWTTPNSWDQPSDVSCGRGGIRAIYSVHNNQKEDRVFKFRCQEANSEFDKLSVQSWSGFQDWDGHGIWRCTQMNGVFNSLYSYHSNDKEDRRFKIRCGVLPASMKITSISGFTPWTAYDGTFEQDCGENGFISTFETRHDNDREDRKFRFTCSTVAAKTPPTQEFTVEYIPADKVTAR